MAHAHVAPSSSTGCSDVRTDLVSLDTALDVRTKDVPKVSVSKDEVVPNNLPIADGGGLGSTADWLIPQAQSDLFQPLRRKFEQMAKQWGFVSKLQQHVAAPTVEGFLSQDQIHCLRKHWCPS